MYRRTPSSAKAEKRYKPPWNGTSRVKRAEKLSVGRPQAVLGLSFPKLRLSGPSPSARIISGEPARSRLLKYSPFHCVVGTVAMHWLAGSLTVMVNAADVAVPPLPSSALTCTPVKVPAATVAGGA